MPSRTLPLPRWRALVSHFSIPKFPKHSPEGAKADCAPAFFHEVQDILFFDLAWFRKKMSSVETRPQS